MYVGRQVVQAACIAWRPCCWCAFRVLSSSWTRDATHTQTCQHASQHAGAAPNKYEPGPRLPAPSPCSRSVGKIKTQQTTPPLTRHRLHERRSAGRVSSVCQKHRSGAAKQLPHNQAYLAWVGLMREVHIVSIDLVDWHVKRGRCDGLCGCWCQQQRRAHACCGKPVCVAVAAAKLCWMDGSGVYHVSGVAAQHLSGMRDQKKSHNRTDQKIDLLCFSCIHAGTS